MKTTFTILLILAVIVCQAQTDGQYENGSTIEEATTDENVESVSGTEEAMWEGPSTTNFGVGLGLGYGGFGCRFSVLPEQHVSLFGAIGFNLQTIGYNVGGTVRLFPQKPITPTLIGMYGYNTVMLVKGATQLNKTYYGSSFGAGLEFNTQNFSYLNIEVVVPVRSQKYKNDVAALDGTPNVQVKQPLPVTITIGYHVRF